VRQNTEKAAENLAVQCALCIRETGICMWVRTNFMYCGKAARLPRLLFFCKSCVVCPIPVSLFSSKC